MALAKLTDAVRRNELLVLASVLAGLVMALFLMTLTWATGASLWAFPSYVAATVFRSLQTADPLNLSWPQIAAGFGLHLLVTLVLGGLFAKVSPPLRDVTGLDSVSETPAYGVLGLGFGLAVFATAWWGVLPHANPLLVAGMDTTFFAMAHAAWGLILGVTRKAWNQTTPQTARSRASASPRPTVAASSHKAPSSPPTGPAAAGTDASAQEAATRQPEGEEEDASDDEPGASDPSPPDEPSETAAAEEDLSPWPAPPEPGDYEEASTDDGYADAVSRSANAGSSDSGSDEGDDDGLAMTDHARRSLRGLTNREPDLPPVHRALDTTLTHVAPGRAVCTIDADERLHDATGAVQSGVLISLGELAATIAMETVAPDAQHSTVASEIQVDGFVEEGHVVAEAEVTEQAGTTTLAEVEVRDASGKVLVAATFQAATDDE